MSNNEFADSYNLSWLILKWWVAPIVAVLAGFVIGAVVRYGAVATINIGVASLYGSPPALSDVYDCEA